MNRIITERLVLRPFTYDDIGCIYAIFSDRELNRFLPWFPLACPAEAEDFLTPCIARSFLLSAEPCFDPKKCN